jgi:nicotinamidase-related amidase
MFRIDKSDLPVVLTRKALLVLDLQNDVVSSGGIISVENPPGFVENAINLAVHFRNSGNDVIWVRSEFEGSRRVNSESRRSDSVITDRELAQVRRAATADVPSRSRVSQRLLDLYSEMVEDELDLEQLSELQLNSDKFEKPNDETFLTVEHGQSAKYVLPGSPGADFTPLASQNIDKAKDLIFQKSYYSAFRDGTLVQTLRAKFVTEIYLCGALTNISIFATAMDAARHGYSIAIVEDCLGYQSKERHDAALLKLTEVAGCDILSTEDVLQNLPPAIIRSQQAPRTQASDRLQHAAPVATSGISKSRLPNGHGGREDASTSEELAESEGKKREKVQTNIKGRRRPSRSTPGVSSIGDSTPSTDALSDNLTLAVENRTNIVERPEGSPMHLDDPLNLVTKSPRQEESAPLCEGDTTVINNLLDEELSKGVFDMIRDEVVWQKMSHRGGDVPRLIAVQGDVAEDGSVPIYRHPADESPPLLPFSPVVSEVRAVVERRLGHAVNHVLIQFYRDGNDYISEHSDKTLDIVANTFIANVSLGAQRTMVFRTKKDVQSKDIPDDTETPEPRKVHRAPLPHNSMCKVGLVTNMRWLHGIRQDKRMTSQKSEAELAYDGGRISLTFRLIGTFIDKNEQTIWGQGATGKTKNEAKAVSNGETPDAERMVRAFGRENHSSEFDWEETYGRGFDVLHISNLPKLFLSGDVMADLAVKIMLAEYGIAWLDRSIFPTFGWKDNPSRTETIPENHHLKYVDNDVGKPTVEGDMAVMFYLDTIYGPKVPKARDDLARQFTRMQKAYDLLEIWRGLPHTMERFKTTLDIWEGYAEEGPFLAGSKLSPVDFAITPLLIELKKEWPVNPGFVNLDNYVVRMLERDSVKKVVGNLNHQKEQNTTSAQGLITIHAPGVGGNF